MRHYTKAFVGIDTSKLRNAIAIADGGGGGEVRYLGEFLRHGGDQSRMGWTVRAPERLSECVEAYQEEARRHASQIHRSRSHHHRN